MSPKTNSKKNVVSSKDETNTEALRRLEKLVFTSDSKVENTEVDLVPGTSSGTWVNPDLDTVIPTENVLIEKF